MIHLRKIEPADLPFLYQWENDASSWADADTHNPLSQQDMRDYIESTTGDIYRDGQLRLIIEEPSAVSVQPSGASEHSEKGRQPSAIGNATLGCIDLFDLDIRNRKAAIGMYVAPEARGRGVGRAAVEALEQYAFGHLNLRLLYAVIAERNESCTALYRSMGYQSTAKLPGWTLEGDAVVWIKRSPSLT